ncbi:YwqH-like family protein [Virgibacillus natechei]
MTSLGQLRSQKATVLKGMSDSRDQISTMTDKISRLQEASNTLTTNIDELETTKSNIDGLSVDEGKWQGKNKTTFEDQYNAYKDSVKDFLSKTKDAKEGIDEEIKRAEQSKINYTNGLNNLEDSLNSLENQIKLAEKE